MKYLTTALSAKHNKKSFSCGRVALDNYLHKQASQDIRRKLTACFVLPEENGRIKGFYTLSNDNIPQDQIPESFKKRMPRAYTYLPTTLLGRLGVSIGHQGQGIGEMLLIDALKRSADTSEIIGSMAVVVDPLDKVAEKFYSKYGFILLPDSGRMFLPMKMVKKLF